MGSSMLGSVSGDTDVAVHRDENSVPVDVEGEGPLGVTIEDISSPTEALLSDTNSDEEKGPLASLASESHEVDSTASSDDFLKQDDADEGSTSSKQDDGPPPLEVTTVQSVQQNGLDRTADNVKNADDAVPLEQQAEESVENDVSLKTSGYGNGSEKTTEAITTSMPNGNNDNFRTWTVNVQRETQMASSVSSSKCPHLLEHHRKALEKMPKV